MRQTNNKCIKWQYSFDLERKYGKDFKVNFKILYGNPSIFLFNILIIDIEIFSKHWMNNETVFD